MERNEKAKAERASWKGLKNKNGRPYGSHVKGSHHKSKTK